MHARRIIAVILCASLAGCATAGGPRVAASPQNRRISDPAVLAEYVQKLPPGSAVHVERTNGKALRGTLMKATETLLIVQPRTRIPEPAVEIPLTDVLSVTPEPAGGGNTIAKAIGAGAAAGAAAAVAVFFVILAMFND
jgi:type IV pilus biogenesis protein CpaD/CtpE